MKVTLVQLLKSQLLVVLRLLFFQSLLLLNLKIKGVATKAVGFELSDLVINGGTATDFTKVTDSKYTVNIYPSDIPTSVTVTSASRRVFWESLVSQSPRHQSTSTLVAKSNSLTLVLHLTRSNLLETVQHFLMVTSLRVITKVTVGIVVSIPQ